ncbi:LpqB family beta-propeller domain-containing protein, partial [Phenylobacterium sp.]|uniref:LpqB family beta-propeller domain-containing protein n=1 Tax=Phenylobacterium sp. TaxID=1871053 RepID=UPI00286A790B
MIFRILMAAYAALFAWPSAAAPIEAYGKLPAIEAVEISPDGTHIAVIRTVNEERQVIVRNVATGAAHGMRVGDIKVRDVRWASPDHLLIVTSATATILNVIAPKSEWRMVGLYNIK